MNSDVADRAIEKLMDTIISKDATIAALRAEVERLKAENAQMKCNFAPILHFARQEQEKKGEPLTVIDSEGIPIENAVLRRDFKALRSRLAAAEGKVEWLTDTLTTILWSYEQLAPNDERIEQVRKAMDAMKGGGDE